MAKRTQKKKSPETSGKLKTQLEAISGKILQVEKSAEKQLKDIFEKTTKNRSEQLKKVQALIREAKQMDSGRLLSSAERLRKEIETKAEDGMENVFRKLRIGTHREVDSLKKKISLLEKRIKDLETGSQSTNEVSDS